ncbi:MAG: NAD(P)-dependent oxidoreductase [Halothiobacillaceae bacterium]|nr:NAD(P)-dependent oxidoreductase [Halothiobacillaceae bacterium]
MKISLIGTGLLGSAAAERLLASGHRLTLWNRDRRKSNALAQHGALMAETPAAALHASAVTLLFLADRAAIEAVLLNTETSQALQGRTVINMGTISPADSLALASALHAHGADYAECPALGSLPEARSGTLILMFGGTPAQFDAFAPLLRSLGSEPRHIGSIGQASALKLAMNQLIASETAAFAMSLALVQAHGVAVEDFMQVLRGSALYAPTFDKKLERMLSGDFTRPNFPLNHLIKDVRLFVESAEALSIDTQVLQALATNLKDVSAAGHGQEDYSVLQLGFKSAQN